MAAIKPRDIELYNSAEFFLDIYKEYDMEKLPQWVKENIGQAKVYGNQKKCVILPDGRKYPITQTSPINARFNKFFYKRGRISI